MAEKFSLKDHLFNKDKVVYLASLFKSADQSFKDKEFVAEVMKELPSLELKERIKLIARVLSSYLPTDYKKATALIVRSLPPPLDPSKSDDDFGDFIFAPLGEYVVINGHEAERLQISLDTLRELTMRFSMEDSVRYFLRNFKAETLSVMAKWAQDDNYHVRRLVSEGTRPLLPWSGRVPLTSLETLPLLNKLYTDKTRYVTRSVANHLNDIAKSDPDLVIKTLQTWQKQAKQDQAELLWMTKHALRTLVKRGHQEALALLGYSGGEVEMVNFNLADNKKEITFGQTLEIELELKCRGEGDLLIDYIVHFKKKNGSLAPKVFKWKMIPGKVDIVLKLSKRHTLKADATTFTLYPGQHVIEVQINGQVQERKIYFVLTDAN